MNIGTGEDEMIKELAELIQGIVGYTGNIHWNNNKPDGTPRKLMDVSKINSFGWEASIDLPTGIKMVYEAINETKWN